MRLVTTPTALCLTLSRLLVVAGFVKIKFLTKNKYDAKRKYD